MSVFHVWLTVVRPFEETKLITELIYKGYDVHPAADDGIFVLSTDNSASVVMACRVKRELTTARELYDDMQTVLTKHNNIYHSIIITEFSVNSLWNTGNYLVDKTLSSFLDKKDSKNNIN